MSKDFSGRTVFITGSAQGIGLATATILASRGANLALADLQIAGVQKAADSLAKEYGVKTLPIQVDVTKPDQVKKVIAQTIEHFGSLDHAVNAAGVAGLKGAGATFSEYPVDDWNFVMNVNCNGVFYCCQAQVAAMLKAGTKGSIVNIASTAGVIAFPTQAAYVASKHAVIGITRSAALEHAGNGIRINAVLPGFTATDLLTSLSNEGAMLDAMASSVPQKRLARPQEIGELITFLLSDRASFINGSCHTCDGAHTATGSGCVQ